MMSYASTSHASTLLWMAVMLLLFVGHGDVVNAGVNAFVPHPAHATHVGAQRRQHPSRLHASDDKPTDDAPTSPPTEQPQQTPQTNRRNQLSPRDMMRALGTSPRRIALGTLSATGIALAGNLFGVTSKLLATVPEDTVEMTGLDTYFPRGDFKRCRENGYTFVIPKEWVADTFVALAKAQRQTRTLDYQMSSTSSRRAAGAPSTLPDSAFGPPGRLNKNGVSEQGDTNVSVIRSTNLVGFSLQGTLGSPRNAADTLLRVSLAPEGSGRVATLVDAFDDAARQVYQFEYTVDRGARGPPLRAISVIGSKDSTALVTMTVVAPAEDWKNELTSAKLRKVASSFHLTGSS